MARKKAAVTRAAGVSSVAVRSRTGKTWDQWFALLDDAGAAKMTHKEIVAHLVKRHGVDPWWQQMVTVAYEQARGLRQPHQTTTGFEVSRSMTLAVPVSRLYRVWHDARQRARWLKAKGYTIRKTTPRKTIRITWNDAATAVDVYFIAKDKGKSQVTVQHRKLASAKEVERMRDYWGVALERLKALLLSGQG